MEFHTYDEALSRMILEEIKELAELKYCYNNVAHVVSTYLSKFGRGEWKVTYGFWNSTAGIWPRHCFILTEDNEVIDPTAALNSERKDNRYISFATLELSEYQELLVANDMCPTLHIQLQQKDLECRKQLREKYGIICIG